MRRRRLVLGTVAALAGTSLTACGGGERSEAGGPSASSTPAAVAPASCTPAPGKGGRIDVQAAWSPGDRRTVQTVKSRASAGSTTESTATATVEVVSMDGRGSTLRWTSDDFGLPAGTELPEPVRRELHDIGTDVELRYRVDRDGAYRRLENVDEVRGQMERTLDVLGSAFGSQPEAAQALAAMRDLVLSDAFLQSAAVEDPASLHAPYGLRLREGRPGLYDYSLPSPFGGAPLPGTVEIELIDARDDAGCAVITFDVKPQRRAFNAALRRFLGQAGGAGAGDVPPAELRTLTRFTYDPGSSWMTAVETEKRITVGGDQRVDRTEMTIR